MINAAIWLGNRSLFFLKRWLAVVHHHLHMLRLSLILSLSISWVTFLLLFHSSCMVQLLLPFLHELHWVKSHTFARVTTVDGGLLRLDEPLYRLIDLALCLSLLTHRLFPFNLQATTSGVKLARLGLWEVFLTQLKGQLRCAWFCETFHKDVSG